MVLPTGTPTASSTPTIFAQPVRTATTLVPVTNAYLSTLSAKITYRMALALLVIPVTKLMARTVSSQAELRTPSVEASTQAEFALAASLATSTTKPPQNASHSTPFARVPTSLMDHALPASQDTPSISATAKLPSRTLTAKSSSNPNACNAQPDSI